MSIPNKFNPFGISKSESFMEFTSGWRVKLQLGYVSEKPLPVYIDGVYWGDLPIHQTYSLEVTDKILENKHVKIIIPKNTYLYHTTYAIGGGTQLNNMSIITFRIKGYSPPCLQDFLYACSKLTSIDIDEEELTKNCNRGWRVFADCYNLVFTPTSQYWWENPNWTGNHGYVFRNCTSMPNYNNIPDNWKTS